MIVLVMMLHVQIKNIIISNGILYNKRLILQ